MRFYHVVNFDPLTFSVFYITAARDLHALFFKSMKMPNSISTELVKEYKGEELFYFFCWLLLSWFSRLSSSMTKTPLGHLGLFSVDIECSHSSLVLCSLGAPVSFHTSALRESRQPVVGDNVQ